MWGEWAELNAFIDVTAFQMIVWGEKTPRETGVLIILSSLELSGRRDVDAVYRGTDQKSWWF